MSKAQTDIRTTSYDELAARPFGYTGTIDEALAQIRADDASQSYLVSARETLLHYLGVEFSASNGPSVELDIGVRYGFDPVVVENKYTVSYAIARGWVHQAPRDLGARLLALNGPQLRLYENLRERLGVREALDRAESFPYPAPAEPGYGNKFTDDFSHI